MKNQVAIGLDIGGTSIKYGLVSSEGKVYWESRRPTLAKTTRMVVEDNILEAVYQCLEKAERMNLLVETIGVGTPGLVKDHNVIIGGADNIADWVNVPLGKLISTELAMPVYVSNDAEMMAIGEYGLSSPDTASLIFITLGTGIGGAIIINEELYRGHFGFGGELGVFPMIINGEVRNWEDVASTSALIELYQTRFDDFNNTVDGKYIFGKYLEGEQLATETIVKWVELVGMGLAGYINIFNPGKVIIGGGVSEAGCFLIDMIRNQVRRYAIKECLENVELLPAELGNRAGFIGAAIYGIKKLKQKR
ncbi:MAG: ROK family protein [Cyclobacteriaceae bacterium]